ncbi:MAG: FkbM family methyltransferase, partial [Halobacteriaceae archaeon]
VDGGEVSVLRGLRDTLSSERCRKVYCEVHPEAIKEYGARESEVYDLLNQSGFETERADMSHEGRGDAYYLIAKR